MSRNIPKHNTIMPHIMRFIYIPTLINLTIVGNVAVTEFGLGGGLANLAQSDTILTNCLLWAKDARDGRSIGEEIDNSSDSTLTIS